MEGDGSGGSFLAGQDQVCSMATKPEVAVDPVLREAPMQADGSGGCSLAVCEQVCSMAAKPNIVVGLESTPENDENGVLIKEEIDLGEDWIKGERGLHTPSDYLKLFSQGLSITDEATDKENEPVNRADETKIKEETIDNDQTTEDDVPDGVTSNSEKNTVENEIAVKVDAADNDQSTDDHVRDQNTSASERGATEKIAMKVEAADEMKSESENRPVITQELADEMKSESENRPVITQELASSDENGNEVPMAEQSENYQDSALPQQESMAQEELATVIPEAPPASPTAAQETNEDAAPTQVESGIQETATVAKEVVPPALPTAAGDDPGNNRHTAPTQQKSTMREIPTITIAEFPAAPRTAAPEKPLDNNNSVRLQEIPVVSSHSDGTELIGALLVSQTSGGGQWHKLYDSKGRELCLNHFLKYRKRKWLAIEISGNSHSGAKEARLAQRLANLTGVSGTHGTANREALPQRTVGTTTQTPAEPAPGTPRGNEEAGVPDTANGSFQPWQNSDQSLPETEDTHQGNQKPEN